MIRIKCKTCNKEFKVKNRRANTAKYCSLRCRWQAEGTSKIVDCAFCGKSIKRTGTRLKEHNYCNAKCQMAYEYANGIRNRNTITLKANETIRKFGNPKLRGRVGSTKGRKMPQLAKFGEKNPMWGKFGKAHHNYKTGASTGRKLAWGRWIYQNWRKAVFAKDDYTCQMCGDNKGGNLHAHHIRPWANCMEGRYDITNGITLCESCHQNLHSKDENIQAICHCMEITI